MKKFVSMIIWTIVLCSFTTGAFANSGPTYWQGYPSSNIMLIEGNSPIIVEKENLVFDFSDEDYSDHTVSGKVNATYEMLNPTDEPRSVQMAFPFVGRINELSSEDITIAVDGNHLSYDLYIGDVVDSHGALADDKAASFEFEEIVTSITEETYKAEHFSENEKGKLYTINVNPTSDQRINFAVDFIFDFNKTKVLTHGFNRYERDGEKVKIAAGCYEPEVLRIYVLGEDIDFSINAYSDGELREKTDLLTYEISTNEVELRSYLMEYVKNNSYHGFSSMISDTQLYNVYARALDKYFASGFSSEDLLGQGNYQRIMTLVYTVEFPPNSEKEVSVSYKTSGTMDMRETADPLYTFDYILNPAKNWGDFKDLNITITPPEKAPYIVKSSIEFNNDKGVYTANLAQLPEEDLSFTLYENEKITWFDRTIGRYARSLPYFLFFLRIIILPLIIIVAVAVILFKIIKKRHSA